MKQKDFTYAVARIRSKELGLLNAQHMEQLIGCKSFEEALHFLADRGWGSPDEPLEAERLLEGEMDRTWQTVEEMVDDKTVFDTLRVADDFHNLKAAIKQLGIDYPQIMNNQGEASEPYGVTYIPQIILFGPDGTILRRGLRGPEIMEAVEKYLKD